MGLCKFNEEYGHTVAFVNYPHQEQGRHVSEYRFLDANTGEFAWGDPDLTNHFFKEYFYFRIKNNYDGFIDLAVYYPLEGYHSLPVGTYDR